MKQIPKLQRVTFHRYLSLCRKENTLQFPYLVSSTNRFTLLTSHQTKQLSTESKNNSLVDVTLKPHSLSRIKNPWVEQKDPNGSSLVYYWNTETNETTHLGAPKPRNWVEVKDPNGSELTYWWDPEAHETTALGAPRPSSIAIPENNPHLIQPFGVHQQPQTLGSSMKGMFVWGFGMSFAIALVGSLFR